MANLKHIDLTVTKVASMAIEAMEGIFTSYALMSNEDGSVEVLASVDHDTTRAVHLKVTNENLEVHIKPDFKEQGEKLTNRIKEHMFSAVSARMLLNEVKGAAEASRSTIN